MSNPRCAEQPLAPVGLVGLTGVILAGGLGTRLRSVVADRPKVLAPVCGRPFLFRLLDQLVEVGLGHILLCTGHMADQIRSAVGPTYRGVSVTYSEEAEPLGTGGALRLAWHLIRSQTALVLNGDSYCPADLERLWSWHVAHDARATLLLAHMDDTRRYGRVAAAADGRILGFDEKGTATGSGWINAGVYLVQREMIGTIPEQRPVSLERECFPAWIAHGLWGYRGAGGVLDIGTPESYAAAQAAFSDTPLAEIRSVAPRGGQ